ncbi:hypothetical protein AgCh_016933 [Apium graveolens]
MQQIHHGAESKALSKVMSKTLKTANDQIISRTYKDIKYFVHDNVKEFGCWQYGLGLWLVICLQGVEGVSRIIMVVLMAIAFTLASPWLRLRKVIKGKDPRANPPKDPSADSLKDDKENKGSLEKILNKLTGFNDFWNTSPLRHCLRIAHCSWYQTLPDI